MTNLLQGLGTEPAGADEGLSGCPQAQPWTAGHKPPYTCDHTRAHNSSPVPPLTVVQVLKIPSVHLKRGTTVNVGIPCQPIPSASQVSLVKTEPARGLEELRPNHAPSAVLDEVPPGHRVSSLPVGLHLHPRLTGLTQAQGLMLALLEEERPRLHPSGPEVWMGKPHGP